VTCERLSQLRADVALVDPELVPELEVPELEVPDLAAPSASRSKIRTAFPPFEITMTFSPVVGTPRTGMRVVDVTASVTDLLSGRRTVIAELEIEVTTPRSNS
jgi:hypothetical protein